jgi:hypothetical protein
LNVGGRRTNGYPGERAREDKRQQVMGKPFDLQQPFQKRAATVAVRDGAQPATGLVSPTDGRN